MSDKAQIFLIAPPVTDAQAALDLLGRACATGEVAAILLPFATTDEREQVRLVKAVAPALQQAGAAVLVAASPLVAARGGADGAHVPQRDDDAVDDAVDALKPERIVGVGGLRTRHDAMTMGERDIDYLLFGEPRADGSLPDFDTVLERVGWWAEIFAVPCVGFAASLDRVAPIAATGAEFVGLGDAVWSHPEGPAAAILAARAVIDATEVQPGVTGSDDDGPEDDAPEDDDPENDDPENDDPDDDTPDLPDR